MRDQLGDWINSKRVQNFIMAVILVNAVVLGLETSATTMARFGSVILMIDLICLAIFVVELGIKLFAFGPRFFRSGWNIFDLVVIAIALAPDSGTFSVLRALRILRLFRIISVTPSLRRVVEGFIRALPGMASVFLLMAIIFYVSAVISTKLFGPQFGEWFGTIGRSAYSLFQIMTLESWSMGIVRPVMVEFPFAWAFFVPFIMLTTFAVVNLLVGLVVNSLQEAATEESGKEEIAFRDEVLERLKAIEGRLPPAANAPEAPAASRVTNA